MIYINVGSIHCRVNIKMSFIYFLIRYSVVSIKRTGGNKRSGWAEFFHLLHEKRVQGGVKNIFIT